MDDQTIIDFNDYRACEKEFLETSEILTFMEYEEPSFKEINFLDENE